MVGEDLSSFLALLLTWERTTERNLLQGTPPPTNLRISLNLRTTPQVGIVACYPPKMGEKNSALHAGSDNTACWDSSPQPQVGGGSAFFFRGGGGKNVPPPPHSQSFPWIFGPPQAENFLGYMGKWIKSNGPPNFFASLPTKMLPPPAFPPRKKTTRWGNTLYAKDYQMPSAAVKIQKHFWIFL